MNWRAISSNSATLVLLAGLATSASATETGLPALLDHFNQLLTRIPSSAGNGNSSYRLTYDADFPCSVSITEQGLLDTDQWTRQYRFELHDLQAGELINARDNRRAISYYGVKREKNGTEVAYTPKKIAAFSLKGVTEAELQRQLQVTLDQLIHICEEANLF